MFTVTEPNQVAPDMDSVATMKVCRVCLAMSVKMYHMSEHKLSVMFKRVTGVEINTGDKLPKMLCWECVARLSSANHFVEKALKTHSILLNKLSRIKFITIGDIESIDKVQNQLKSSLGCKFFNVNETYLHINNEAIVIGNKYNNKNIDDGAVKEVVTDRICNNEKHIIKEEVTGDEICQMVVEQVNIKIEPDCEFNSDSYENVGEPEFYETSESDNNFDDGNMIKKEVPGYEYQIKSELIDENGELGVNKDVVKKDSENHEIMDVNNEELVFCIKEENTSDERDNESSKVEELRRGCEVRKGGMRKNNRQTQPRNEKNKTLPVNMLRVGERDSLKHLLLSYKPQISDKTTDTAQSSKHENQKIKRRYVVNRQAEVVDKFIKRVEPAKATSHTNNTISVATVNTNLVPQPSKVFSCTYCSYTTYYKSALNRHINCKHTQKTVFNCSYCSYKAYRNVNLTEHINAQHTKVTSFNCSFCSYKTYQKRNLTLHINIKHIKTEVHACLFCSFKTYIKSDLNRHISTKHNNGTIYNCSHCCYRTNQKRNLSLHINLKHTQKTVYNCPHCAFKTYRKSNLSAHVNTKHTKSITFDCTYCDYKTYQKVHLTQHLKAKHS